MISTVDTSTLRNHLADVIEELEEKRDYILVTRRAKPVTAVVNLDFFEELLALSSPEYLKGIQQARQDYRKGKVFSHGEVFGEIG